MATNKTTEERKPIKVVGTVLFYGKTDTYNKKNGKLKEGDPEKEYLLAIKDYQIKNWDIEQINKWYTNDRGKVELPNMYEDLKAYMDGEGDAPEILYFKSQYPVDHFQIIEDSTVVDKEIDYNPDLSGCRISMSMYRQYIGQIAIKELPPEYTRIAFDAIEFDEL